MRVVATPISRLPDRCLRKLVRKTESTGLSQFFTVNTLAVCIGFRERLNRRIHAHHVAMELLPCLVPHSYFPLVCRRVLHPCS